MPTLTRQQPPAQSVLVADDDPDLLELLSMALSTQGYDVHKATDGQSAVEVHDKVHPQLMILDWMMPGMTGLEACRHIREDGHDTETPVLIYSAMGPGFADEALDIRAGEVRHAVDEVLIDPSGQGLADLERVMLDVRLFGGIGLRDVERDVRASVVIDG